MKIPINATVQVRLSILALGAVPSTGAWAEGDPGKGRSLAQGSCTACHGVDGNARSASFDVAPMPAGQPAAYPVRAMNGYADGTRAESSRKGRMAREPGLLSEAGFEDVAAYYEAQARNQRCEVDPITPGGPFAAGATAARRSI